MADTNIQTENNETTGNSLNKSSFFSYKGFPLVRNRDTIYYGNMSDQFVVMMQVTEKTRMGNLDIASRVKIYQMATDEKLAPNEAIVKTSEKTSLYEALDIAYIWLSRTAAD